MEKRRFEQVCGSEEEDGEFRPGGASEEDNSKRARIGEFNEGGGVEVDWEEEESRFNSQYENDLSSASLPRRGERDVHPENANENDEIKDDQQKNSKPARNMSSPREFPSLEESPESEKPGTQKSRSSEESETHLALRKSGALTGDAHRTKWVEKFVQDFKFVDCTEETVPCENGKEGKKSSSLRDSVFPATVDLEKAVYGALGSDFRKYNQKMRQLNFNFKHNTFLARRFLKRELEPAVIVNMTPEELKEGSTHQEKMKQEPEESQYIQMADARCSRCSETRVGVVEIIHAGGHGDRYQLECASCGHTWSASIDDISSLTIDSPSGVRNVGAAPWATAKFEDVERELMSPHEGGKSSTDLLQRATEPYIPVLETRRSVERWSPELETSPTFTKVTD